MKKITLCLGIAVFSLIGMNMLFARHGHHGGGGSSFAGGMAGGMVGGMVAGAMTQPKSETVVVQQPQPADTGSYWKEKSGDVERQNEQLKRENEQLRKNLENLDERLAKVEKEAKK
jgi:hypothetical protein